MNPIKNRLVDSIRWKPGAFIQDNGGAAYSFSSSDTLVSRLIFPAVQETDDLLRRLLARIKR